MIGEKMNRKVCPKCGTYLMGEDFEKVAVPGAIFFPCREVGTPLPTPFFHLFARSCVLPAGPPGTASFGSIDGGLVGPVPFTGVRKAVEPEKVLSCACEKVMLTITDGAEPLFSCYDHSQEERATTGTPFNHLVAYAADAVKLNGDYVVSHKIAETTRHLCKNCGTYMLGVSMSGDTVVPAGLIPAAQRAPATYHRHCSSCILPEGLPEDGLPKYDAAAPVTVVEGEK